MNLFRPLPAAGLLLAGAFTSCLNAPDYGIEPAIDFKEIQVTRVPTGRQTEIDTLKFVLNFRDGDGDLGLTDEDLLVAPYNSTTGGPNNRGYSFNYFIQSFVKNAAGEFVPFFPGGTLGEYDGRFPRLVKEASAKPAPIRGMLNYKLPLSVDGGVFYSGQVLRFEISILDRALHQSNTVTTSEVTLGQ